MSPKGFRDLKRKSRWPEKVQVQQQRTQLAVGGSQFAQSRTLKISGEVERVQDWSKERLAFEICGPKRVQRSERNSRWPEKVQVQQLAGLRCVKSI